MSDSSSKPGKRRAETPKREGGIALASASANRLRNIAASVVWIVAVVCALTLAVGALLVALDFNRGNAVVDAILNVANSIDFGEFKDFQPDVKKGASAADKDSARQSAETKSVMVNWGIAAIIYLVVGKVLERLLRPKKTAKA